MIKILLTTALISLLLIYSFQERLIFFPQPLDEYARNTLSRYAVSFNRDGVRLSGWLLKGEISTEQPLIIYYGGNAEEVSGNAGDLERYGTRSFLLMNYRGFGDSEGKPGEQALKADALYILDELRRQHRVPLEHIVLVGRSLGSGIATYVGRHRQVKGIILVSPYDSLVALGHHHYPYLPVSLMLRHRFNSAVLAPEIKTPMLALIGSEDRVVPPRHSKVLVEHWGGPTQTVLLKGVGHNDISTHPDYWRAIRAFLQQIKNTEEDEAPGLPGA
jgi:hypothetical protein